MRATDPVDLYIKEHKKATGQRASAAIHSFGIIRGKSVKNMPKIDFFSELLIFLEQFVRIMSKSLTSPQFLKKSRAIRSQLLFCKEQREQFSHSRSFLKSDESESLFNMSDLLVF